MQPVRGTVILCRLLNALTDLLVAFRCFCQKLSLGPLEAMLAAMEHTPDRVIETHDRFFG